MTQVTRRALSTLTALVMTGTLFIGAPSPTYANGSSVIYWVSQSGSAGTGTSCTDADFVGGDQTPIAAAVAAASSGDTIYICAGTYAIEATINLGGESIKLQGAAATTTILDGGGTIGILESVGDITVLDLTFRDGYSADDGGAIYAHTDTGAQTTIGTAAVTATVTVINSRFISNDADVDGGAIYATTAAIVTNSRFISNDASDDGGAIYADAVTVTSSTFTGNTADEGGAIYGGGQSVGVSTATVTSSTFTGNTAAFYGGAISAGTATVTSSTFTGNTAEEGGAILAFTGTIARSRFIRNTAGGHGGAVHLFAPTSDNLQKLRGNTFTRNRAGAGGAIVLGSCGTVVPGAAKAARVERANRFSGNRATVKRRTNNIETGYCGD
jgi:hypothetical protein